MKRQLVCVTVLAAAGGWGNCWGADDQASDTQRANASCHQTQSGTEQNLAGGVILLSNIESKSAGNVVATLAYFVPQNSVMRLISGVTVVADPNTDARQALRAKYLTEQCDPGRSFASCVVHVPLTTRIPGATSREGSLTLGHPSKAVFFLLDIPAMLESDFQIHPPEMEINGLILKPPHLSVRRKSDGTWSVDC